MARALGVASTGPGGVLLLGATPVGRAIGRALQDQGLKVIVWTRNDERARAAKADGLSVYQGDPTADAAADAPSELDELEYALAVGDDEALNAMVATDLSEYFGREHVFQLPASDGRTADFYTRAQVLFDDSANHDELLSRIKAGAEITVTEAPAAGKNGKDAGARPGGHAADVRPHTWEGPARPRCGRPARSRARAGADQPGKRGGHRDSGPIELLQRGNLPHRKGIRMADRPVFLYAAIYDDARRCRGRLRGRLRPPRRRSDRDLRLGGDREGRGRQGPRPQDREADPARRLDRGRRRGLGRDHLPARDHRQRDRRRRRRRTDRPPEGRGLARRSQGARRRARGREAPP